ncbi:MAG: hypothetical protein HC796_02175 [Synechococcaceae cyanobacterium RL_1_2]|nr:hypothetical protein [Synechococcaceae cyanobacterium RL_1_2]
MTLIYLWGNEQVEAQVRKVLAIYATQITPGPSMLPQGLSWLSQENLIICCPDTWSLELGNKQEFKIEQFKDLGVAFEKVARAYEIMA